MVRPKIKNGEHLQLYVEKEIISLIEEYKKNLSRSEFVERAVLAVVKGCSGDIELYQNLKEAQNKLKVLQGENERIKKENEKFQKKIQKLELEVQGWRAKWDGQKTLDKYSRKAREIKLLAQKISEHIAEGKTVTEVLSEAEIFEIGDQVDVFKKLFEPEDPRMGWRNNDEFLSKYFPGWRVVKKDQEGGILKMVFLKENGHTRKDKTLAGGMKNA